MAEVRVEELTEGIGRSRNKYFRIHGPKGSIKVAITYAYKYGVIQYQVDRYDAGNGWIENVRGLQEVMRDAIGWTFTHRGKWAEALYTKEGNPPPKVTIEEDEHGKTVTFDGPTDRVTFSKRTTRAEQQQLRDLLFRGKESVACAICARSFPPEMMITAHIKKRSLASESERLDDNIVVPMCKAGCDALFELGWIGVEDGNVIRLRTQPSTSSVEELITGVKGRACAYYRGSAIVYFQWHAAHHKS